MLSDFHFVVANLLVVDQPGPEIGLFINQDKSKILTGKRNSPHTMAKEYQAHYNQLGLSDNNIIVHYDNIIPEKVFL